MAGRPLRRQRERERHQKPNYPHLAAIYAEEYTSFEALRATMLQNGIVDHGINSFDVIQRAIDDTTTDYLLIRQHIERQTHGDPNKLTNHPLYEHMLHTRESMVRYATFATQYDIQRRALKLSETRVALLATTLRNTLQKLGIQQEIIHQIPKLMIESLQTPDNRIDPNKALALTEILHNDSQVDVIDADTNEVIKLQDRRTRALPQAQKPPQQQGSGNNKKRQPKKPPEDQDDG
jgi:hypothetical protein